ncbi:MAG: hypothetical protein E6G44_08355 [Actinobacteria bacterium]|nr:MAG: hypothetical protein E6G44_08355 [Actinomycetota bacterium]
MDKAPSREDLEAAHCWEAVDRVQGRPEMTAFRQRLRYHQARWRESKGHPIGTEPIVPRKAKQSRLVGSRLPFDYALETGANFVTRRALAAARARTSFIEPHQSFDHRRLWADLLWSPAFAFNLFGDPAADLELADRAVHTWWPDVPGTVSDVRFAHSPGRLDPTWLGNLVDFDVAFALDLGKGRQGILGVQTKYHDRIESREPKPTRAPHYRRIAERSGVFEPEAIDAVNRRSPLLVMWLEHLLVHSMLQHPSGAWTWGRLVVVHPAGNTDFAEACDRYRELMADRATFSSMSLEGLLDAGDLPAKTDRALRRRYLPG